MKVLGVDDNPDIIQLLEMTVESLGHEFDPHWAVRKALKGSAMKNLISYFWISRCLTLRDWT